MQIRISNSENTATIDLARIISHYLPLHESRKVFKGRCPFHADTAYSLMVYPSRNQFKCFGCGIEGDAADFIMAYEGTNRKDAIEQADLILNLQVKSA